MKIRKDAPKTASGGRRSLTRYEITNLLFFLTIIVALGVLVTFVFRYYGTRNQEIPDELVDDSEAVDIELKAGQMSVHDGQLFHASNPNRSTRRRCGLTVRYIPPHVKQAELNSYKQKWQPILLRGEDRFGHFPKTEKPFPLL